MGGGIAGGALLGFAYVQRRRSQNAKAAGATTTIDHHAWGRGADVLWAMMLAWMIWALGTWLFIGNPW